MRGCELPGGVSSIVILVQLLILQSLLSCSLFAVRVSVQDVIAACASCSLFAVQDAKARLSLGLEHGFWRREWREQHGNGLRLKGLSCAQGSRGQGVLVHPNKKTKRQTLMTHFWSADQALSTRNFCPFQQFHLHHHHQVMCILGRIALTRLHGRNSIVEALAC